MKNRSKREMSLYGRSAKFTSLLAFSIVMTLSAAGCSPSNNNNSPSSTAPSNATLTADQKKHIRIYTVEQSSYHKTIDTTGIVDFDNDQATSVLAPISGPVAHLLVSPGDHVGKGQPLAVVDSPDFATAVSAYRKAVTTAQTNRHLADADKDLLSHQGVAQREEAQAQTDAAGAEADREAALQALVSLGVRPQTIKEIQAGRIVSHIDGVIRSPIAGTVVEKLITPGELLQAGTTPCFTIANISRVWVMAQIFGTDLASVRVGDSAVVQSLNIPEKMAGRVDNVAALVNPDTRSVGARVVIDNPGGALKKQMYVHVQIQSQQEMSGLLIPVSAILRDDENLPFVYVVDRDGSFARRHVTLGYRAGDRNEIASGLHIGDQIVVDGAIFVQFMQSQ